jgi:hypothetical protein
VRAHAQPHACAGASHRSRVFASAADACWLCQGPRLGWSGDVVPPSQRPRLVKRLEILEMQIRTTIDAGVLEAAEQADAEAQAEAARDEDMGEGEGVQNVE